MFDQARVEAAVRELLYAIGEDPDRHGLEDTPARVARTYREMFAGLYTDPDTVLNTTFDEQHDELVMVKDIPLYSTCEHHLVAFHGVAHVGYIPGDDGRVTGLSKIARLVDLYARRPQVQERLTGQIADALMRKLDPRGVIVVVEAEHLCMAMRGCASPERSPPRRRCGDSSRPTPRLEPKRSSSSCASDHHARAGNGRGERHRRLVLGRRALPGP
ncbi:GTP cyclohydrolase I [Mycobacterium xenopi 4042]|uniref:GTP cyclohydrolase 1 n=1 Tax=Mycobacterium xenopi 4042 TaxID=1299334 RepID=X7ZWN3_MYCXE|nr:GTP cyclohydrolase I [Mycobacterium xenopi 4042]